MKIFTFLVATLVHFLTFLQTLAGFYLISKSSQHPWFHEKFIYLENIFSNFQIKIANTSIKDAQFFLAKIALYISLISLLLFFVFSTLEWRKPLIVIIYTMVFSFYFVMAIHLGYKPRKLFNFFSKPYLQLTLMSLVCGAFELLGFFNFICDAVDHIYSLLNLTEQQYLHLPIVKVLIFCLFPLLLYITSFVFVYIFTIPIFGISTILVGILLLLSRLLNNVAPEQKLSVSCAIGLFIQDNFKKLME